MGPLASPLLLHLCSRSIGYEADAHREELFNGQETATCFLDYKRGDARHWVENAVFPIYRNRLGDPALAANSVRALMRLQEQGYMGRSGRRSKSRHDARCVLGSPLLERVGFENHVGPLSGAVRDR